MIRAAAVLAVILGAACPAQAAGDLLYTYKPAEIRPLKSYNNQPYWRLLAQCAGLHGALANRYQAAARDADHRAAVSRGVLFLRTAMQRISADRGLPSDAARVLAAEEVEAGRVAGVELLSGRPASGYSHEQLFDLLCTQVATRHEAALRHQRR